ncbi:hypothetical protein HCH15_03450 [Corynebacterium testudinoris]|uniref:hypothetical protein n=1 Tax=Corynebacterium testudinoris TaxID=136857 RepID=UPI001C8C1E45|nr:hypothetical protein [Corynebacterium testudinoris]MBX8995241.1 hypothetical protein [Corynebacterium testudinoris]
MSEPTKTKHLIPVQVEILGRTDFMEPEQRSLIEQMPGYMENEGLKAEIRFREPGGMGGILESISLFIQDPAVQGWLAGVGTALAKDVAKDLAKDSVLKVAKSAIKAVIDWSKDRLNQEKGATENDKIQIMAYGPTGELLSVITVSSQEVIHEKPLKDSEDE